MAKSIKSIINDTDRKSYLRMTRDLMVLLIKYKSFKALNVYGSDLMYKKNAGSLRDYISSKKKINIYKFFYRVNGEDPVLQNKIVFSEYLRENKVKAANFLGKIKSNYFIYNDTRLLVNSYEDLKTYFISILKSHPSIFIKKVDSQGRKDVFKIEDNILDELSHIDLNSDYIIEETIIQHPILNKIYPNSINNLRVVPYRYEQQIFFPSIFLRIGSGNSIKDNASSGGIFINYDLEKNSLDKVDYTLLEYGRKSYYYQPDTKVKFENYKLLYTEEIKDLLTQAALLFNRKIIGWDVAFTVNGPIIIEGNDNPGVKSLQITNKGLLNNKMLKEIFKEVL